MVGRKPSPLMPRKKRKPTSKPPAEDTKKETSAPDTDEELVDRPQRSSAPKRKKVKTSRLRHGIKPSAPQEQLSTEDKRVMRRRRQRRRLILRIAIAVVVCLLSVVIILNWNSLTPDKIWAWVLDLINGGTGSFPVDLSGTNAQRVVQVEGYTAVLTDSHLLYLDDKGAEVTRYGCSFADPLVRAEGNYVLIAEQGGTRLQLTSRNKLLKEWKTEEKTYTIRAVSLNAKGQTAVLTEGPQGYQVRLCVYDETGKLLYARNSNSNILDVAISPDGSTIGVTAVEADNGTLNTRIEVFSLKSTSSKPKSSYVAANTLLYRIGYLSEGMLAAVHENGVVLMNPKNGAVSPYVSKDMHVLGYAISGNSIALATRPYGDTDGGKVTVVSASGAASCHVSFTGEFRHLSGHKGTYALLTDNYVQGISSSGSKGKASAPADGLQAVWNGSRIVVMGRNQLDDYKLK